MRPDTIVIRAARPVKELAVNILWVALVWGGESAFENINYLLPALRLDMGK